MHNTFHIFCLYVAAPDVVRMVKRINIWRGLSVINDFKTKEDEIKIDDVRDRLPEYLERYVEGYNPK